MLKTLNPSAINEILIFSPMLMLRVRRTSCEKNGSPFEKLSGKNITGITSFLGVLGRHFRWPSTIKVQADICAAVGVGVVGRSTAFERTLALCFSTAARIS